MAETQKTEKDWAGTLDEFRRLFRTVRVGMVKTASRAQEEKAYSTGYQPCYNCGRPIKDDAIRFMVHDLDGGNGVFLHPDDEAAYQEWQAEGGDNPGDMGFYPIGADCLRKYPQMRPFASRVQERRADRDRPQDTPAGD